MIKDRLLALLFPPKCVFCGTLLAGREPDVCPRCMDDIRLGGRRLRTGPFFDGAVSALGYTGRTREALHRFKFSGKQRYAVPFARILAFVLGQGEPHGCELVVAVPTNRRNLRRRGYNHAGLLGRELAGLLGVPYLDGLTKCRQTRPMFGLKIAERRANVLGAFALKCRPEAVCGRRILIVDDVITTGATLSECARVLKENGASFVLCATLASAGRENDSNR